MVLSTSAPEVTEAINAEAVYTVSARVSPSSTFEVNYNVRVLDVQNVGDFIATGELGNKTKMLDLTGGKTGTITVPISNDDLVENDSAVFVTLLEETDGIQHYSVSSMQSEREVRIDLIDDESLPVLRITDPAGSTAESAREVAFILSTTTNPGPSLMVRYEPYEVASGNFLDSDPANNQEAISSQSVIFSSSDGGATYTGTLMVPIHDDNSNEATGQIGVRLLAQEGVLQRYQVGMSNFSATATIWDNDAPELILSTTTPEVTEAVNAEAVFTVTARVSPSNSFAVHYNVRVSSIQNAGNFIAVGELGDTFATLDLTGGKTDTITVPISEDDMAENDSSVSVRLLDETPEIRNYTVSSVASEREVEIRLIDDESLPEFSITVPTIPVPENAGLVPFTLTTTTNPGTSLMIRYDPAEVASANFLDSASGNDQEKITTQLVGFSSRDSGVTYTGLLLVPIHNDNVGENTGQIMVTLLVEEGVAPKYRVSSTNNSATATIWDDDAPILMVLDATAIKESDNAELRFPLFASVSPNTSIEIYYELVERAEIGDGDFILDSRQGTGKMQSVDFTGNKRLSSLNIPVESDTNPEGGSIITVTLEAQPGNLADASYNLATKNIPATTTIDDDDLLPEISISSDAETIGVSERYSFEFKVTTPNNVGADLDVMVAITDENNNNLSPSLQGGGTTITIPSGTREAEGIIRMNQGFNVRGVDSVNLGQIKVAIVANPGTYNVDSNDDEILVAVKDSDVGNAENPVLTISGPASVVEGGTARYSISASHTPSSAPLEVSVLVSNRSGEFLASGQAGSRVVEISTLDTPATFDVTTVADNPDREAGSILVSLIEGSGYALSPPRNLADPIPSYIVTQVIDPPIVSITKGPDINEGQNARFTVTSIPNSDAPFNVRVQFSQTGDFLVKPELDQNQNAPYISNLERIREIPISLFTEHLEPTVLDYDPESEGMVTATILPPNQASAVQYVVDNGKKTASVNVANVDNYSTLPVVTLANELVSSGVTRGYNFEIKVQLDSAVIREIQIPYIIENVGDKAPSINSLRGEIIIPAHQISGSRLISVDSNFTGDVSSDAKYKVTLVRTPQSFRFDQTQGGVIEIPVRDNSTPTATRPLVSITSTHTSEVIEGNSVTFRVEATPAPSSDVIAQIWVSASGNFVAESQLKLRTVRLTNSLPSNTFDVATLTENLYGDFGEVTARVMQGDGYVLPVIETDLGSRSFSLDAQNKEIEAIVVIEKSLSVSISTAVDKVIEGQSFLVRLTPSTIPTRIIPIKMQISETGNFVRPVSLSKESVDLQIATYTEFIVFAVANNDQIDSDSVVTIKIIDSSGYQLGSVFSKSITIFDRGIPSARPNVTIQAISNSVVEGNPARFKISLDPEVVTQTTIVNGKLVSEEVPNVVIVSLNVSDMNNALRKDVRTTQSVIIHGSEIFEVPTRTPNGAEDSASSITVSLLTGRKSNSKEYQLADVPNHEASVSITDDAPILSISTVNFTMDEGNSITFSVSVQPPEAKVAYQYRVSETGNFVDTSLLGLFERTAISPDYNQISINTKSANAQFDADSVVSVQLIADQAELNTDGSIKIPANYILGKSASASVTILDDTTPEDGVSIVAVNDTVKAGEIAQFQIRSDTPVSGNKSINVVIEANMQNMILPNNASQSITLENGEKSKFFDVRTEHPKGFSGSAIVTVTLQDGGSDYSLAATNTSASISVIENQSLPIASFVIKTPVITEGDIAQIDFSLSNSASHYLFPDEGIDVDFSIIQTGPNFLNFRGLSGTGNKSIKFNKLGTISYTLITRALTESSTGTISITLNEDSSSPVQYKRALIANHTKSISVNDIGDDIPMLSISEVNPLASISPIYSVTEGEIWQVKVTIEPPAPYPFTVWLTGTQTGNFLSAENYSSMHDVKTGDDALIVLGSTIDDLKDEADGTISLTLNAQEGYLVDKQNDDITFAIKDNDDEPIVSFNSSSVIALEDSGNMRFDIQLSRVSAKEVTINYELENGTAVSPGDFDPANTELVFPVGVKSIPLLVPVVDDGENSEDNESFNLKITSATNGQFEDWASEIVATGTIIDNDNTAAKPVIWVNNPRISENIAGGKMTFEISMSHTLSENVELSFSTSDGTATELGQDYTGISNHAFDIVAGADSATITVDVNTDYIDEFDETFNVIFTLVSDNAEFVGKVATLTAIGTIIDDDRDPILVLAEESVSADENDEKLSFVVNVVDPITKQLIVSSKEISVEYIAVDHTGQVTNPALENVDFVLSGTELTIPAGQSSSMITINLVRTDEKEDDEVFTLVLRNPKNATFGNGFPYLRGIGTITDFDGTDILPTLSVVDLASPVVESTDSVDFIVTATAAKTLVVRYQASEVNGGDFLTTGQEEIKNTSLTFAQAGGIGPYFDTLNVPIHNDEIGEATGQIKLTLLPETGIVKTYQVKSDGTEDAMVLIWDDDAPVISISNAPNITESANTELRFPLAALVSPDASITIYYTLAESTESGDGNFVASGEEGSGKFQTVDFSGDRKDSYLVIPIESDTKEEGGSVITVTLEAQPGNLTDADYDLASPNTPAMATISDDDSLPLLSIAEPANPTAESTGSIDFVVTASVETSLTIRYQASEVNGDDFLNVGKGQEDIKTESLTFAQIGGSGRFVDLLRVSVHDDEIGEDTGQIVVTLLGETEIVKTYRILDDGTEDALATIWDDDAPVISIGNAPDVTELANAELRFPLTALVSPDASITIYYTLVESTESGDGDFIASGEEGSGKFQKVDFSSGLTDGHLVIPIDSDVMEEGSSVVTVTLESQPGNLSDADYNLASPNTPATATISDDDSLPVLSIADVSNPVGENTVSIDFEVTTSSATSLTVRYQASEVNGGDFLDAETGQEDIKTESLTFAQVGGSGLFIDTLSVSIHDDEVGENTGQIEVTLLGETELVRTYQVLADGTEDATATIWDDDAPVISISNAPDITELANAELRFPLTALVSPDASITIYYTLTESTESGDGDFIASDKEGSGKFQTVDFSSGRTDGHLVIPIDSDVMEEGSSVVTVTLESQPGNLSDADYNLASPNTPATAIISDDDSLPVLSIADVTNPFAENSGSIDFEVTASTAISLTIRYQASEVNGGDFLDAVNDQEDIKTEILTFAQVGGRGPFINTLSISIHDDEIGEDTGQIEVTLLAETDSCANLSRIS